MKKLSRATGGDTHVHSHRKTTGWLHLDRTFGGHCHHWGFDRSALACRAEGPRIGQPRTVFEQSEADRYCHAQFPRRLRSPAQRRLAGLVQCHASFSASEYPDPGIARNTALSIYICPTRRGVAKLGGGYSTAVGSGPLDYAAPYFGPVSRNRVDVANTPGSTWGVIVWAEPAVLARPPNN